MLAAAILAQIRPYEHMYVGGFGWGAILFFGLLAALFVALIVWLIVSLATKKKGYTPSAPPSSSSKAAAKSILDERYAKGEIDREDYLQRKADLEG